jgi:chemotaxis protein MotB
MRHKRSIGTEENFWVAYADLMAGLLFVFILLIGAIVLKYVFAQSDLHALQTNLEEQKRVLQLSEEELAARKAEVAQVSDALLRVRAQNVELSFTKAQLEKALQESQTRSQSTEEALLAARAMLAQTAKALEENQASLRLSVEEMDALKKLLLGVEHERDETKEALHVSQRHLRETTNLLEIKDNELALLSKTLLEKTLAHQKLVEDLDIAKARVGNLTGVRIAVIAQLKEKLGNALDVDAASGAIRLPASVLFDRDAYGLKPEAAQTLKKVLLPYFEVLLGDETVREHLDRIIIEGHTDSDGFYMYNLELSQKRASSVMSLIYSWEEVDKEVMQQFLSASGRSYSDRIFANGVENKEASRRIEIKFSISNQKAMQEIETFLKGEY